MPPRLRWLPAALAAALTLPALGCGRDDAATSAGSTLATDAVSAGPPPAPAAAGPARVTPLSAKVAAHEVGIAGGARAALAPAATTEARESTAAGGAPAGARADDPAPLIIRTGNASLEVDSLDLGIARLRQTVAAIPGAYVASMGLDGGRDQTPRATLEVKVPVAEFDRLVTGLAPIGKVETVNVSASDVSEEFVDLAARAENARRLEARLVELLARRAGRLAEVLSVERELARVREEIERYDGRLRFLRTRSAMSTLTVALHEPLPVLGERRPTSPIAEAFRQSWRNLVGFVAAVIAVSGVLVPLALLGYVAWRVVRRFHAATA